MNRAERKVGIVSGAASGIGRAIALELGSQGITVVVADRNAEAGREVAEQCDGLFVETDVARRSDVDAVVQRAMDTFGRLDILVNNAAVTRFVDFFEIDDDHWDEIQAVNARGAFLLMRASARCMRDAGGGAIVNIASIAAKGYRNTSSVAYAASKGTLLGLTRSAAMQLAKYSIRVNAICPGVTLTPLLDDWRASGPNALDQWSRMIGEIPLGVPNRPAHIATLAAYLVSPAAETITGQSWNVDGGLIID